MTTWVASICLFVQTPKKVGEGLFAPRGASANTHAPAPNSARMSQAYQNRLVVKDWVIQLSYVAIDNLESLTRFSFW